MGRIGLQTCGSSVYARTSPSRPCRGSSPPPSPAFAAVRQRRLCSTRSVGLSRSPLFLADGAGLLAPPHALGSPLFVELARPPTQPAYALASLAILSYAPQVGPVGYWRATQTPLIPSKRDPVFPMMRANKSLGPPSAGSPSKLSSPPSPPPARVRRPALRRVRSASRRQSSPRLARRSTPVPPVSPQIPS